MTRVKYLTHPVTRYTVSRLRHPRLLSRARRRTLRQAHAHAANQVHLWNQTK